MINNNDTLPLLFVILPINIQPIHHRESVTTNRCNQGNRDSVITEQVRAKEEKEGKIQKSFWFSFPSRLMYFVFLVK